MLLIPIRQEDDVVRRLPWVSFALIALNFVAFVAASSSGPSDREIDARFGAFLSYLEAHPYLEPTPDVTRFLGDDFEEELDHLREAWRKAGGEAPFAATEQERLDELGLVLLGRIHERPSFRFGYVPGQPSVATAFTSMFMHAGWLHLIGNMLFLFLSGPFIEDCYGRALYAALYGLSHFAALWAHVAHQPGSMVPLVGASGAIAGIMGAFLIRLGTKRIRFLFIPILFLPFVRRFVVLPAFVVLPLWLGEQLVYAQSVPNASVAFWAHIGGFLFGAVVALLLRAAKVEERIIHPAIEKEIGITQNPALERAMEARLRGDLKTARRELNLVLRAEPENPEAWREAYEAAVEARDPVEAGRAGERLMALLVKTKETQLASELAYDPRWRELEGIPGRFLMAVASFLERAGDARAALDEYDTVVLQAPTDPLALRALVRRAEILKKGGDRKGAREAFERAKAHPSCTDPWPALVDKGLRDLSESNGA